MQRQETKKKKKRKMKRERKRERKRKHQNRKKRKRKRSLRNQRQRKINKCLHKRKRRRFDMQKGLTIRVRYSSVRLLCHQNLRKKNIELQCVDMDTLQVRTCSFEAVQFFGRLMISTTGELLREFHAILFPCPPIIINRRCNIHSQDHYVP